MSPIKDTGHPVVLRLLLVSLVLLAAATVLSSPGLAQSSGPSNSSPSEDSLGPTDEREVEAFLDGYLGHQLEDYDIPGATVSVVKDGEVLFAKGYGQASLGKNGSVVADETLFRIASITKLFTSTAAMQLVEEGKLDLHRDVNAYLKDVEIPNTYPGRPVTLHHLLTHSAGFEEHYTGSGARGASDVEPLEEYLSTYLTGDADPTIPYEKVKPYEAPPLHVGLLIGSLVLFLLTTLAWPAGALISHRYIRRYGVQAKDKLGANARTARRARVLAWAVSALILLFVIGMAMVFSNAGVTLANVSPSLVAILTLPLLITAGTVGVVVYAALAWKRRYWGLFGRLYYSLVALCRC